MASEKKNNMKYVYLGKTGTKVSELCLGAMTFGRGEKNGWGLPTTNEQASHHMLDAFVQAGGNFIDTADVYGPAESEEVLGTWLAKHDSRFRENLVLATKVRMMVGAGPNDIGCGRKHIIDSIEQSLKRLQTNYVDLYQLHAWDTKTPLKETFSTLNDLVRCGKIRYIGISNFTGWQLQKALDLTEYMGLESAVSLQPQYNLLCRDIEYDSLAVARDNGLAVLPWSPLAGGWLSGRYRRGMKEPEAGSRVAWAEGAKWSATNWTDKAVDSTWNVIDQVFNIAQEVNATPAQVSLRWLLQTPGITSPIIGAKTLTQLQDNLACVNWQLSDEQMQRLNKASENVYVPYPFAMQQNRRDR